MWAIYLMPHAAKPPSLIFLIPHLHPAVYGAFQRMSSRTTEILNAYFTVSHSGTVLFAILMLNTTYR